jgi:hypothetical protein
MDINTQNSSGMMNGMPPQPQSERKVGPIVGALIIVLILIIAALYFFGQKLNTNSPATVSPSPETSLNQSSNDTASAIQAEDDNITTLEQDLDIQLKDVEYSF